MVTVRAGCTIDPINYFANDNLATMSRNNSKRARETETNHSIQRQQKLQSSLDYNYNNNSVAQDEAPKQNLVSTGLRLSYDNDERNSCANGSITTPMFQSLGDTIRLDLDRQKEELDQFLKFQVLILSVISYIYIYIYPMLLIVLSLETGEPTGERCERYKTETCHVLCHGLREGCEHEASRERPGDRKHEEEEPGTRGKDKTSGGRISELALQGKVQ